MGFGHYWARPAELPQEPFAKAVEEIRLVLDTLSGRGVKLAGPVGIGKPELTRRTVAFNGEAACGHRYRHLENAWPSPTATGIDADPWASPLTGPWSSGEVPQIETRTCGGSCAAKPFVMDAHYLKQEGEQAEGDGLYYSHCETGFKPYDLAVTASLIRFKEHLGPALSVWSDGQEHAFEDAKRLCRELFGWPLRFSLNQPAPEEAEEAEIK